MRTIPNVLFNEDPSKRETAPGEVKIFYSFKSIRTYNQWYCIHSLNLSTHLYQKMGEIDFVLIGPDGIYVFEVKSGRVKRDVNTGIWDYGSYKKKISPFDQALHNVESLVVDIDRKNIISIGSNKFYYGYGAIFPSVSFREQSPEWNQNYILDEIDIFESPFFMELYLERTINYWKKEQGKNGKRFLLHESQVLSLVNYLRSNFELIPSLRSSVEEIEGHLLRLTTNQYGALDKLAVNTQIIFEGGAGCGKTFLAIEEAKRQAAAGNKILFLCFNPILSEFLKNKVTSKNIFIYSVHELFYLHIQEKLDFERFPNIKSINSEAYLNKLPELVCKNNIEPIYDVLIIDEAQDMLSFNYLLALNCFLKGGLQNGIWRIFIDSKNQKFIQGIFEEVAYQLLRGYKPTTYLLTMNVRNTKETANETKLWTGLDFCELSNVSGPAFQIIYYKDKADCIKMLSDHIELLIKDNLQQGHVTFLSSLDYKDSVVSDKSLKKYNIVPIDRKKSVSFPFNSYTFCKISDFKGLENQIIVLLDVDERNICTTQELYVALTRASYAVTIFINESLNKFITDLKSRNSSLIKRVNENE